MIFQSELLLSPVFYSSHLKRCDSPATLSKVSPSIAQSKPFLEREASPLDLGLGPAELQRLEQSGVFRDSSSSDSQGLEQPSLKSIGVGTIPLGKTVADAKRFQVGSSMSIENQSHNVSPAQTNVNEGLNIWIPSSSREKESTCTEDVMSNVTEQSSSVIDMPFPHAAHAEVVPSLDVPEREEAAKKDLSGKVAGFDGSGQRREPPFTLRDAEPQNAGVTPESQVLITPSAMSATVATSSENMSNDSTSHAKEKSSPVVTLRDGVHESSLHIDKPHGLASAVSSAAISQSQILNEVDAPRIQGATPSSPQLDSDASKVRAAEKELGTDELPDISSSIQSGSSGGIPQVLEATPSTPKEQTAEAGLSSESQALGTSDKTPNVDASRAQSQETTGANLKHAPPSSLQGGNSVEGKASENATSGQIADQSGPVAVPTPEAIPTSATSAAAPPEPQAEEGWRRGTRERRKPVPVEPITVMPEKNTSKSAFKGKISKGSKPRPRRKETKGLTNKVGTEEMEVDSKEDDFSGGVFGQYEGPAGPLRAYEVFPSQDFIFTKPLWTPENSDVTVSK